jgi:hypothetical protein
LNEKTKKTSNTKEVFFYKIECKMRTLKFLITIVVIALLFGGCKYDFILPEEVPIVDPEDPNAEQISFSSAIVPIFTGKCISCHKTGGQIPDLTADNAFPSLNSTRYINSASPEESRIYSRANPANTDSHPKYSAAEAAKVLGWIQQGAKNN